MLNHKRTITLKAKLLLSALLGLGMLASPLLNGQDEQGETEAQPQQISPEQMAQFQEQMAAHQKRMEAAEAKLAGITPEEEANLLKQLAVLLSSQISSIGLNEQEQADFVKNFEAALNDKSKVDLNEENELLFSLYLQNRMTAQQEASFQKLLDGVEGLVTTDSGLKYKVEKEGTGAAVQEGSVVTLNYKGTLLDGTVFDSTEGRGPAEFDLGKMGLIPGFLEGLLTIKEGGSSTLYIPAELAYGARPPQGIPPNAPLIFEVEVLGVK